MCPSVGGRNALEGRPAGGFSPGANTTSKRSLVGVCAGASGASLRGPSSTVGVCAGVSGASLRGPSSALPGGRGGAAGSIVVEPLSRNQPINAIHSPLDRSDKYLPDTPDNEQEGNPAPNRRRNAGGTLEIMRDPPYDRTEHPPAIQRKTRDQVKKS